MISVIIPVYGAEKTLEKCIGSILKQKYLDYEIVLTDDGSGDLSAEICDELCANNPWVTVVHKKNAGPSSARNIGIAHASGKYFVCVDSDDIVKPSYLSDFIDIITKFPEVGHAWCGFESESQNGRQYICSKEEIYSIKDRSDYQELHEKVLVQSPCFHLFRTDVVKKNNIRMRDDISLGEDIIFNLEYLDAEKDTKIGIINKANYVYLDTDSSSLNNRYRSDLCRINELINGETEKYLNKWGIIDKSSFYNTAVNRYTEALDNTFNPQNRMTLSEKIRHNSEILKRKGFVTALNNSTCYINPMLKRAYLSGSYRRVIFVKWLSKVKNGFLK